MLCWAAAFVVGVITASVTPEELFPAARAVVFCAVFLGIGVFGEIRRLVHAVRRESRPRRPPDARPADGRVDWIPVPGANRRVNPIDPRIGCFLDRANASARAAGDPEAWGMVPLLGRVVINSLYVGMDGRAWSDREIADSFQAVERAGVWLEREAMRWGAAVNVELADTYFVANESEPDEVVVGFAQEGDEVGPLEEGAASKALLLATRAASRLGFRDAAELVGFVSREAKADANVWLLHLRREGRSFAVPQDESILPGVCLAVCYCREASFPGPLARVARTDPVTVAHELLHLFGATDKYNRDLRDYAPNAVTSREVMRLSETRLPRLRIDPETAREIGWTA